MVYIGRRTYQYGRMKMSHMIADSESELHEMAGRLGVSRRHFQHIKGKNHYDICKQNKEIALQLGAVEVDDREIVLKLKGKS